MSRALSALRTPQPLAPDGLRVVALGGLGEIGRNMTVFEHAGRLLGFFSTYFFQNCMSVRRAHERRMALVGQGDVVGVLAGTGKEAIVLFARDARANKRGVHSLPPIALAPAMMLLTMLW